VKVQSLPLVPVKALRDQEQPVDRHPDLARRGLGKGQDPRKVEGRPLETEELGTVLQEETVVEPAADQRKEVPGFKKLNLPKKKSRTRSSKHWQGSRAVENPEGVGIKTEGIKGVKEERNWLKDKKKQNY
jgi:hypothetical protein